MLTRSLKLPVETRRLMNLPSGDIVDVANIAIQRPDSQSSNDQPRVEADKICGFMVKPMRRHAQEYIPHMSRLQ